MSPTTVLGAIAAHSQTRPEAAALIDDQIALGWGELVERMRAAAATMADRGVGSGDRVGILAENGVEAVIAYLAAIAAGGVAVPLPMSLRAEGLGALLANCDPKLIVADPAGTMACAGIPDFRWQIAAPGTLWSDRRAARPTFDARPEAPFNIIYSSGTTGQPKGIVHSHAMRDGQAGRTAFGLGPELRMLLSTPLYSNTTLVPLLATLFHGGAARLMRRFDALDYLRLVQDWRATHTMLVPVQYRRLMDLAGFDRFDLRSMQVKQSTSAPFDADLKADVLARFPGRLIEVYGLTEGGVSSVLDASAHPQRLDTVGRPAAGVELKVIDTADAELPPGAIGEVIGHSPWMMTGYWGRPDLTAAMQWHHRDGRVFFRSGDLGFLDADGFLHIVGRRKEMINSGGFNIYPVDLERALCAHPDVAEAAVVAIPSRKWGETPFAVVVLRRDATADGAAILRWANDRLGRTQRIDGIEIRPDLPRSSIGKVAKAELAQTYRDRATT